MLGVFLLHMFLCSIIHLLQVVPFLQHEFIKGGTYCMSDFNYQGGYVNQPASPYAQNAYQQPTVVPVQYQQNNNRQTPTQTSPLQGMLPIEQSYIENILRLNKGKYVSIFCTFENNNQWNAKQFDGIIEAAGRDHIIIRERDSERRIMILMVYVDYFVFYEEMLYDYPTLPGAQVSTYSPR